MSNISPRESKPIARRDSFIGRKVYPAQESVGTELTGRSEVSSEVNPTLDSHIDSPETVKSEKFQESKQHPEDKKEEHHRNGHHKDHDVLTYLNPNNIHNLHGLHPSGGGHDSDGDSSDNDPEIDHISVRKLPCIIMPSSPARIAWDMFILILLGFILVTTPLELAFEEVEENLETAALVIDTIFLVDVVINFITAYRVMDDEDIIEVRLHKIAWRYATSWFVLDVLSCPSILLLALTMKGLPSEFSLLKLLKGAKTLKMLKMVKVLKVLRVNKLMGNYALELEELMMRGSIQVRVKLTQLLLVVVLSAHFLACFWLAISRTTTGHESWMFKYSDLDDDGADIFFNEWSVRDQYVTSFYFAIMTMTTVGFGDIVPSSTNERLFMIAAMVVGGGMYGFIIASLASVVTSLDMNQKQYYTKMDTIHSYMSYRRFPTALRHRVHRYFRKFYEVNSALDEKAILNDLPDNLRIEVMKLIVNESVSANYIFQNLPDEAATQLASLFKPAEVDDDRDYIIKRGEPGNMMFIITSGIAEYSGVIHHRSERLPENSQLSDSPTGILEAGDCFGGLVGLGMENFYNITVTSFEHTPLEVLVATKEDILTAFSDEVLTLLRKRAWEHVMITRKVKKKNKKMIGINGSGVGPYNLKEFMKFKPIPSTLEDHHKHGSFLSPLSFLMHHHSHAEVGKHTTHRKSKTYSGQNDRFLNNDATSDSTHAPFINTTKKQKSFEGQSRRRNTTGDVLLHSESISLDSEDNINVQNTGDSAIGVIEEDNTETGSRRRRMRKSVSQSDMEPLHHHTLTPPSSAVHHIQHYPQRAAQSQYSSNMSHGGNSHHKKHNGSTTRGNGGEQLPLGFSENVFELLEQVLDEVALVNQRMVETEDSLNSLKKLQRRSSATSMLFGQHLDSSSPPPLMMENEQKTQSQPQNTRNRPANLNVHLPINNHLPPLSPSLTPTGVLLPMNTPTSFSESGAPSPAFTFTHTSFPNDENSYLSISMQIEAKWLPLCSYQHPYFRIVRPGKHLREGHHYEAPNSIPSSCIVYKSEVSSSGKCASPSWNPFNIKIHYLKVKESSSKRSKEDKWDEVFILECWDWNRSTAHNLIGCHYTTLGNLRDINGNPKDVTGENKEASSALIRTSRASEDSVEELSLPVHDFTLVRPDKLEAGRLCITKYEGEL